ncbi:hypothetical protein F5884DRAFT_59037 [Xylogone sp. PMI_703]|nr:hypothetical protein F5884DRAFT_59037 [Xylogone sp. PMI_703]
MSERGQRRYHRKSKLGCLACKQRHKRCDEKKPYCGNCLKYGTKCSYFNDSAGCLQEQNRYDTPLQQHSHVTALSALAHDESTMYRHLNNQYPYSGIPPGLNPLASIFNAAEAFLVVEYEATIPKMAIMPRCRDGIISDIAKAYEVQAGIRTEWLTRVYRYLHLACAYEINKHSLLSLAGTFHHRDTMHTRSLDIALHHRQFALRTLQRSIERFGIDNADSILAASMNLSNQSANWYVINLPNLNCSSYCCTPHDGDIELTMR